MTTLIIQGKSPTQAAEVIAKSWKRGAIPKFITQDKLKPLDCLGTPTQHRQRELTRLKEQLADLRAKTKKAAPSWIQPLDTDEASRCYDEDAEKAEWEGEDISKLAEHVLI